MSRFVRTRVLILVLVLIMIGASACNNGTPTPAPNVYNPGCSVPNLIAHISQANSNSPAVINLANCVYTLEKSDNSAQVDGVTVYNGLPVITGEITIQGNNAVIEVQEDPGEPFFGPFFVDPNGDLELYDLLISDGSRPVGGAVVNNGGDFFANDVTFRNNLAFPADSGMPARGGAIFSVDGRVRVIDGSHFQENTAGETMTSGVNLGGAIYNKNGTLLVTNSSFLWNHASGDGGAIYAEKTQANEGGGLITITDSQFNENTADLNGGGLAVVNEEEGVFITTTAFRGGEAGNYGGAVYAEGSEVNGTYVEYRFNTAQYGGAVYTRRLGEGLLSQYNDELSEYIGNIAFEIGGGIFSENSDLALDDCFINQNTANSCGGIRNGGNPGIDVLAGDLENAQQIHSDSVIQASFILNNNALVGSGGGVCHLMGELTTWENTIAGNSAADSGGGMILHAKSSHRANAFNMNNARHGGGLLIGFPLQSGSAGEILVEHHDYLDFHTSIEGNSFSSNNASTSGGGIYAHHDGTTAISSSLFQANTAAHTGGGILRFDGKLFVNNSTFSGNSAYRGGGIYQHSQVGSIMGIKHTTFAFNNAAETSDGGNVYNLSWGGGGFNGGNHATIENSLFYQNSPEDCQLSSGTNYTAQDTYDSDGTCGSFTEPAPLLGPLAHNGSGLWTHALLQGSPLIDILPDCAGLTEDQRGVARPQGANCDPGAYEYDPSNPPAPPPPPAPGSEDLGEPPAEEEDSPDFCDLFDELDITTVVLAIPPETMIMPLYMKMPGGVLGLSLEVPGGPETWNYEAIVGLFESYRCSLQGFPDRLYCMFNLPPDAPGQVLDLALHLQGCEGAVYTQLNLTIPSLICSEDLSEEACLRAGGAYPDVDDPHCECP